VTLDTIAAITIGTTAFTVTGIGFWRLATAIRDLLAEPPDTDPAAIEAQGRWEEDTQW
jgi:hypothetical protein